MNPDSEHLHMLTYFLLKKNDLKSQKNNLSKEFGELKKNNQDTSELSNQLKEIKFDKGTKNFQPTNLEVTKININNTADNVIPGTATALSLIHI